MNSLKHGTVFDIYLFYHRLIYKQLKNINLVANHTNSFNHTNNKKL